MNRGELSLAQWLSRHKARITADWLHLVLLTAPHLAGASNVSLRMYLGDLFDRLVIVVHLPEAPISACVGDDFHIRYRDMPEFGVEDLLRLFKCGESSIDVLLQQEMLLEKMGIDIDVASVELEWAFKHLRHTEFEAFREHQALFTHFSGFERSSVSSCAQSATGDSGPKGSAYPWAVRSSV